MVTINALDLPFSSSFRDPSQVPLLEDLVEAPVEETLVIEEDSSPMRELVGQIEAHIEATRPQSDPVPPAVEKVQPVAPNEPDTT
ncbi:hypothetical protein SO802_015280 [Lithocarpus litseifolius]|uniref:Uncharacterized protein n=1 Tax=Lithocarpus litseifolius TaxID=425828 RepID=A0AAW2CTW4_9ROSI